MDKQSGDLLPLGALVCGKISWSIGILTARHTQWSRPVLQLYPWQLLFATILTFLNAMFWDAHWFLQSVDFTFIGTLLYTGALSIGLGYWGLIIIQNALSPAVISLGLVCVPIISLMTSTLFLREKLSFATVKTASLAEVAYFLKISQNFLTFSLFLYGKKCASNPCLS